MHQLYEYRHQIDNIWHISIDYFHDSMEMLANENGLIDAHAKDIYSNQYFIVEIMINNGGDGTCYKSLVIYSPSLPTQHNSKSIFYRLVLSEKSNRGCESITFTTGLRAQTIMLTKTNILVVREQCSASLAALFWLMLLIFEML